MNQKDVIEFFDQRAARWDQEHERCEETIRLILDQAGVWEGARVLDVACGTGVLFPDYLERKVSSVTAVDISPEMVKLAAQKFPRENIRVICADVEKMTFADPFDCIMVYNAFPHFPEPQRLIRKLASFLKPGGTLTIAHGMSREKIDGHHQKAAGSVSRGLMSEEELAALFEPLFRVTVKISDHRMYQVTGIRLPDVI